MSATGVPRLLAALLLACLAIAGPASAQAPVPDEALVRILVKSTLIALGHANLTGNYTVLRDLGSPRFQASNDAASLAQVYGGLRAAKIDLSPLAVIEPQFTAPVSTDAAGRLRLVGFFPTRPLRVEFDLAFEPIGGRWRLSALAAGAVPWPAEGAAPAAGSGAPTAPAGAEAGAPASAAPATPRARPEGAAPAPAPDVSAPEAPAPAAPQ